MMATAFMGYVLPWGQMSYLGRTGHHRLLLGHPVGRRADPDLAARRLCAGPGGADRFFSLHYLLPFVIAAVVILHIWALHIPGSGNPTGVDVKDEQDTVPVPSRIYTAKDGCSPRRVPARFRARDLFPPNYLGHPDNYIPANPLSTPAHIVPEWYFWPFYAILRAFTVDFILPAKLWGVLAMFGSILLLFFLPWLDRSPVARAATGRCSSASSGSGRRCGRARLCGGAADLPPHYRLGTGRGGLLFPRTFS